MSSDSHYSEYCPSPHQLPYTQDHAGSSTQHTGGYQASGTAQSGGAGDPGRRGSVDSTTSWAGSWDGDTNAEYYGQYEEKVYKMKDETLAESKKKDTAKFAEASHSSHKKKEEYRDDPKGARRRHRDEIARGIEEAERRHRNHDRKRPRRRPRGGEVCHDQHGAVLTPFKEY